MLFKPLCFGAARHMAYETAGVRKQAFHRVLFTLGSQVANGLC